MNLNYLKFLFNKYKFIYLLLLGLYITIYPLFCIFITNSNKYVLIKLIYFPVSICLVLSYLLPIIVNRIYFFKNSANVYLSLPEKRQIIYRTNNYFHLFMSICCFTIAYIISIFIFLMKGLEYNYRYLWLFLLVFLVIVISTYFFVTFVTSLCNSLFDTIVLNIAYFLLPALFLFALFYAFNKVHISLNWSSISFIGATEQSVKYYIQKAVSNNSNTLYNWDVYLLMISITFILHLFSVYKVANYKQDLIGEPTKSIFGYRFIIPIYSFLILLITNYQTGITFVVVLVVLILCYTLFTLYSSKKRKISLLMVLRFVLLVVIANILPFILNR